MAHGTAIAIARAAGAWSRGKHDGRYGSIDAGPPSFTLESIRFACSSSTAASDRSRDRVTRPVLFPHEEETDANTRGGQASRTDSSPVAPKSAIIGRGYSPSILVHSFAVCVHQLHSFISHASRSAIIG